jgi:hypothetical protein
MQIPGTSREIIRELMACQFSLQKIANEIGTPVLYFEQAYQEEKSLHRFTSRLVSLYLHVKLA